MRGRFRYSGSMRRLFELVGSYLLLIWLLLSMGTVMAASSSPAGSEPAIQDELEPAVTTTPAIASTRGYTYFWPVLFTPPAPFPPPPPPLPPPVAYSATVPIDFTAVSADLQQQGLALSTNKIGFHTGLSANDDGLVDWMTALDAAGVPIFLKSVDNAEPLYTAQQLMRQSGVPHTLVFRRAGHPWDVPDYTLPPQQAAQLHWAMHKAAWPSELDPSLVWLETINEVDKSRAEWLGQFALATAQLALADGYRWAAFGWSSGEPEPEHWQTPAMLQFLQLVADHPDQLAIALHEYSFAADDIGLWYPYLVGRFQTLFQVADEHQIPRPTVLITEWGWEYNHVPSPAVAMEHIQWAAWLYAAYPQVKGAAVWYLGGGFGGIADETQLLIAPVRDYSLSHYFAYTPGQGSIDASLFAP